VNDQFAGTAALVRLIVRRDRILLAVWILVVAAAPIGIAASNAALNLSPEALQAYARDVMSTPATVATLGLVFSPTPGGLVAWRSGLQSAILIGPASLLFIIRHTRTEEESGRRELLGSAVVGRHAPLTAALCVVFGANLAIACVIAAGLIAVGLPLAGSIVLGVSAAAVGWVFAALGGVAAQLTQGSGTARAVGLAAFGVAYLVRTLGDAGGEQSGTYWLNWLSPLGWLRLTRAFAGERWWVFGLFGALVATLVAIAFTLSVRRDLGAGLLPQRLGPPAASPGLRNPLALAWRLHRGSLFAWTAGALLFGTLLGSIGQSMSRFVDAPELQGWAVRMGATDAGAAFLFIILYVLGQVASAYAIMATLRMRSEEVEGRADAVLATPVRRSSWALSHLFFAAIGPTIALAALGLTMGVGYGLGAGDLGEHVPRLLARAMVTLPAIWVMAGIATAMYGFIPRFATGISWAALGVFLALELAWELQRVSQSIFDVSPFAHVHWATPVSVTSLIALTIVAAILTTLGLFGFQRRDLTA
jgi:ABC-2 type transport system permease protein